MNLCGNSIKRHRQPQMAKIIKLRGPIQEFTIAVEAYSRGGLLTIFSSKVGAYLKGGAFLRGGGIRGLSLLLYQL